MVRKLNRENLKYSSLHGPRSDPLERHHSLPSQRLLDDQVCLARSPFFEPSSLLGALVGMTNEFDELFGPAEQPVRRNLHRRITVDADGRPVAQIIAGDSVSLSPTGSIDHVTLSLDQFYHCGCNAQQPAGGRCGEPGCGRISCQRCFSRCGRCHKPLCLEHSKTFVADTRISVCASCNGSLRRQQILKSIIETVLSPFVRFDKGQS